MGKSLEQIKRSWIQDHLDLIHLVRTVQSQGRSRNEEQQVLLLYLSESAFPKPFGVFPQYVEAEWLESFQRRLGDDYVEIIFQGDRGPGDVLSLAGTPCG